MPIYTVVARSRASAVFYPGNALETLCKAEDGRDVRLVFRTNYMEGYSVPLPTNFYVEATGLAANLTEASQVFHQTALEVATMMAFAVNADLGRLEIELAFDSSPDLTEHEFIQTFVPNLPVMHVPSRPINPGLVRDFLTVSSGHVERQRIQSAIAQYCEALRRWNAGHGIVCLAHLYMGVEALTKASLRTHVQASGKSEDDLVKEWNIDKKQLDNEVRRRLIFYGDTACFKTAKEVSDRFEHGFGDFSKMHKPAAEVVVKVAAYLRTAIIRLTGANEELSNALLSEPYLQARGPISLIKKVRGSLVGAVENLPMKGRPYPALNWRSGVKAVTFDENGRYRFDPEESFSPELGEGTVLRLGAFEVWDNQLVDQKAAELANQRIPTSSIKAEITRAPKSKSWNWLFSILASLPPWNKLFRKR